MTRHLAIKSTGDSTLLKEKKLQTMLSSSLPFSSTLPRNLAELPHGVLLDH